MTDVNTELEKFINNKNLKRNVKYYDIFSEFQKNFILFKREILMQVWSDGNPNSI